MTAHGRPRKQNEPPGPWPRWLDRFIPPSAKGYSARIGPTPIIVVRTAGSAGTALMAGEVIAVVVPGCVSGGIVVDAGAVTVAAGVAEPWQEHGQQFDWRVWPHPAVTVSASNPAASRTVRGQSMTVVLVHEAGTEGRWYGSVREHGRRR
jgi:hypothetical protein